jgi:dethiobiotin synthetase
MPEMSNSNVIVVTGTDTEVGKTLVTCGLMRRFADRGTDVRGVKPVESGIDELEVEERDGVKLAEAARQDRPTRALTELTRPLAPPEAADIDGVELSFEDWCRQAERISDQAELTFVEGAGGVLSPLTREHSARELADALEAPVLLVAPNELGVLNHTQMAVEVLEQAGIPFVGVVFSRAREGDESTEKNPRTFREFSGRECVAALDRVDGWREASEELDEPETWIRSALELPTPEAP